MMACAYGCEHSGTLAVPLQRLLLLARIYPVNREKFYVLFKIIRYVSLFILYVLFSMLSLSKANRKLRY